MNKEATQPKSGEENTSLRGYAIGVILTFLVTHSCSFLPSGLGISRASEYFDYYSGNMSYTEIPARITVREINETPEENYTWEMLQFGFELDKQQEIIANIEGAGIPTDQIQSIFYSREQFDAPLEVGKTYSVKLDIRANYYSFLFKNKFGFGIHWWKELRDGESLPVIQPYPWPGKLTLYAIACWLQTGLFAAIIFFPNDSNDGPRNKKKFSAGLAGVFILATTWIIYVDFPFYNDWSDYFLQVIAMVVGLGSLGYTVWTLRKQDYSY